MAQSPLKKVGLTTTSLVAGAAALLALAVDPSSANAATSTFKLSDTNQNFVSKGFQSVDGLINLTISNAVGTGLKSLPLNTNLQGFCANVLNLTGGVRCGNAEYAPTSLTGFSMTFDKSVYLSQFNISQFSAGLQSGALTFTSGSQAETINFTSGGTQSFANPFLASAGTAVFVTSSALPSTITSNFRLDDFEVSQASQASVPGPLPILGAGVAFAYSRRLRARILKKAN